MTIIESRLAALQSILSVLDEFEDPADIHAVLAAALAITADLDDEDEEDDDGGGTPLDVPEDEDDEESPFLENQPTCDVLKLAALKNG